MVKNFTLLLFIFLVQNTKAQNLKGQWKGVFYDKSTSIGSYPGDQCEYVLELDLNQKKISGTSYTYFNDNAKRCYTICKVEGFYDVKGKYAEITETERVKTNNPMNNCLQTHKLTYFKKGDIETLEGNWIQAPNQKGNCGSGTTLLTRRSLINTYPNAFSKNKKTVESNNTPIAINKKTTPIKDLKPKGNIKKNEAIVGQEKESTEIGIVGLGDIDSNTEENTDKDDNLKKLEKRKNTLLKKIEVDNKVIKVDLYDNGDIDGDSVSLFYNGKLLLSNKRLTDKAISFNLNIEDDSDSNDLIMFAENLGTIPPNTALMVITDGKNRYEIRITSDLEKSGKIQFVKKHPN